MPQKEKDRKAARVEAAIFDRRRQRSLKEKDLLWYLKRRGFTVDPIGSGYIVYHKVLDEADVEPKQVTLHKYHGKKGYQVSFKAIGYIRRMLLALNELERE